MGTEHFFTTAQIADRLGKSPRIVRRWLKGVRPDGIEIVRGNPAAAFKLESLPGHVREKLKLANWQPEIPWNRIAADQQEQALKLQRAFMPMIERRDCATLSDAEFEVIGARTYQNEFGKPISRERWRYLYDRTLARAGDAGQFHRPELFLPGNLKRADQIASAGAGDADFEALNNCIGSFHDPQHPSGEDIEGLWMEAVELFGELSTSANRKKVKRRLLEWLWRRASFLAASQNALRVKFDRKWKGETPLLDGRRSKRGEQRAPAIPQADVDRIAWHSARNCGGRTTQAARELGELGERSGLSKVALEAITAPHKSKSHVNRRVFAPAHHDAQLIAPYLLGKKAKDDATPSLRRDHSKLRSMMMVTADDFTMPVYWYVPDGKGWWTLTRGQCLLMVDAKSRKIIAWSLQPERNYNGLVIRTLMNRACRKWGLPRTWYFENGIWRNAKVVKGEPREWRKGKSLAELRPGWAQLGVEFIHAKKARSKPSVENVGGAVQDLMEREPGYCGRDERRDCPEATRRNKLAVEARRIEPQGIFLSFDAWHEELARLISTYNSAIQQGEILKGLSPDRAFEHGWPHDDPPAVFDASCWHLLAHYVSERQVGVEGITFRLGNKAFVYRDENSSALRGRKVLAWFDPDCPEMLGITDLNGRNPLLIQQSNPVDCLAALDRDGESGCAFRQELAKAAGHNSYPKARYQVLSAAFEPTFRRNLVAPGVAHVAQTFEAGRAQIEEKQRVNSERAATATKRARKLGLQASVVRPGDALADEGIEMMLRAERDQQGAEAPEGKAQ